VHKVFCDGCVNGCCGELGLCECHEGWSGPNCSVPVTQCAGPWQRGIEAKFYRVDSGVQTLVVTRVDSSIALDAGYSPVAPGVDTDSVRLLWSGALRSRWTGWHVISCVPSARIQVWLDGRALSAPSSTGFWPVFLVAGRYHKVVFDANLRSPRAVSAYLTGPNSVKVGAAGARGDMRHARDANAGCWRRRSLPVTSSGTAPTTAPAPRDRRAVRSAVAGASA
jgi:hypothetical protein